MATRPEPATVAEWPIPTGELSRYFDQAEQWLGVAGAPPRQGAEPPRSDTLRPASTTLLPEHLPSLARFDPVVLPFAFVAGGPRRLAEHDVPRMLATGAALRTGTSVRSVEPARRGATTVHVVDAEPRASERLPTKSFFCLPMAQPSPASSGVTVPSVSWPTIM